ncbi:hypothetical protein BJI67_12905 [Acidihalobacter aeolianus]|uniref:Uncharacterized protein n=1 Tax=Acidihalobacter aeolianus TaxID=2792603 RepID=A0A1D8KA66_9GAMM|nr:hypothetical protein [Acidihalobacter aeolianus]AOV17831.1 hypothetical protein BJI67_12905 [Acidihalobacter aeolianus]
MASKTISTRFDAAALAALRKFPGNTDSERVRSAVMRGTIIDEFSRSIAAQLEAHRRGIDMMLKETMTDSVDAVRDAEREILSALQSLSPDEAVAKKIAGSLSRMIAHGIVPLADMGRREPLMREVRALVHASGELDEE